MKDTLAVLDDLLHTEQHDEDCNCKTANVSKWLEKFQRTHIDSDSKEAITQYEDTLDNHLDTHKDKFVDDLHSTYLTKNSLSFEDLTEAIIRNYEANHDQMKDSLSTHLRSIVDNAKKRARHLIGAPIKKTAGTFEDSVDSAFGSIDNIPNDLIQRLKEEWIASGNNKDIIQDIIRKTIKDAAEEGYNPKEVKEALYELYDKQRYIYRSIIRTTTVNTYAIAQLEEWDEEQIEEVDRNCIDDIKTCAVCRSLCSPGRNRYKIKDLLRLKNPITEFSHPQCRDYFTPVVEWSNLNEFFNEPIVDVSTEKSEIKNLPIAYQEQIDELNKKVSIEGTYEIVPDLTETPEWYNHQFEKYKDSGMSDSQAAQRTDDDKDMLKGHVVSLETEDGILISADSIDQNSFSYQILVSKANQSWNNADHEWVNTLFEERLDSNKVFITSIAEESPRAYFIEAWIMLQLNPVRLESLDTEMYEELLPMK